MKLHINSKLLAFINHGYERNDMEKAWGWILFLVGAIASCCAIAMIVNDLKTATEPFIFTWSWTKAHPMRVIPYSGFVASLGCAMNGIFHYNIFNFKK